MPTSLPIRPERRLTLEQWEAGRAQRRRAGEKVAPAVIRRTQGSSDDRLREAFDGERGPEFSGRGKQ